MLVQPYARSSSEIAVYLGYIEASVQLSHLHKNYYFFQPSAYHLHRLTSLLSYF